MERYIQRNWLKQLLTKLKNEGKISSDTVLAIEQESEATNDRSLYKIFKVLIGLIGCLMILGGIMVIFGDIFKKSEAMMKLMAPLPMLIGGAFYYYYLSSKKHSQLWKEMAVPIFFLTVAFSFPSTLAAYELDFMNNKLILYIILTFGLFLTYKHNSMVTAGLYILLLSVFSSLFSTLGAIGSRELAMVGGMINDGYNWLMMLSWIFLAAIVPYFKMRIENVGIRLGIKEAILGGLFVNAAYQMCTGMAGGYSPLAILVVGPTLYMMSKKYYANGTWYYNRPGSTALISFALLGTLLLSSKDILYGYLFIGGFTKTFELPQILAIVIFAAIGLYGYFFYKREVEENGMKINLILMAFPAVFFLVALIGSTVGYLLFTIYGFVLAWHYLQEGLKMKYTPLVILGGLFGLIFFTARLLTNVIGEIESLTMVGLVVIFIGIVYLSVIQYCKREWSVTNDNIDPNSDNILDDAISMVKSVDVSAVVDDIKGLAGNDAKTDTSKPDTPKTDDTSKNDSEPSEDKPSDDEPKS